jgi:hypothetical protein
MISKKTHVAGFTLSGTVLSRPDCLTGSDTAELFYVYHCVHVCLVNSETHIETVTKATFYAQTKQQQSSKRSIVSEMENEMQT